MNTNKYKLDYIVAIEVFEHNTIEARVIAIETKTTKKGTNVRYELEPISEALKKYGHYNVKEENILGLIGANNET